MPAEPEPTPDDPYDLHASPEMAEAIQRAQGRAVAMRPVEQPPRRPPVKPDPDA